MLRKDLAPEDRGGKEIISSCILLLTDFYLMNLPNIRGTRVVCAPLWSDKVPPVATALKSGAIMHPLVWASQLLLFVLAAVRGWRRKQSCKVSRVSLSHFCALCVWKCSNSDLSLSWILGSRAWRPCRSFGLGMLIVTEKLVFLGFFIVFDGFSVKIVVNLWWVFFPPHVFCSILPRF